MPVVEATYQGPTAPNKDFLAKGYILGQLNPVEKDVAYILRQAFASETVSPLRLRILKERLAQSIFSSDLEGRDNGLAFVFEGMDAAKKRRLKRC